MCELCNFKLSSFIKSSTTSFAVKRLKRQIKWTLDPKCTPVIFLFMVSTLFCHPLLHLNAHVKVRECWSTSTGNVITISSLLVKHFRLSNGGGLSTVNNNTKEILETLYALFFLTMNYEIHYYDYTLGSEFSISRDHVAELYQTSLTYIRLGTRNI